MCDYIRGKGDKNAFLTRFWNAHSKGFDPDLHLHRIGVANQTTMLRSETEQIQGMLRQAIADRDTGITENFRYFDTICGATQERQDALFGLLEESLDLLLASSAATIAPTRRQPRRNRRKRSSRRVHPQCLVPALGQRDQALSTSTTSWKSSPQLAPAKELLTVGITAGASCPQQPDRGLDQAHAELRGETE